MRVSELLAALALLALAGCTTTIPQLNEQPSKYYEQPVTVTGRVARIQELPGETLLEVADARQRRILVRLEGKPEATPGEWVEVSGILLPEARFGGAMVYDVIAADGVRRIRAPFLRNLF